MHIGDTAFGQLARVLSGGKLFAYPEVRSSQATNALTPDTPLPVITLERSSNEISVEHENAEMPEWLVCATRWARLSGVSSSADSKTSKTRKHEEPSESEKEGDGLVTWYSDKDTDNPKNWSTAEKTFNCILICVYTFTVYLGSAIYTPSTPGVMMQFDVSYAAASWGWRCSFSDVSTACHRLARPGTCLATLGY